MPDVPKINPIKSGLSRAKSQAAQQGKDAFSNAMLKGRGTSGQHPVKTMGKAVGGKALGNVKGAAQGFRSGFNDARNINLLRKTPPKDLREHENEQSPRNNSPTQDLRTVGKVAQAGAAKAAKVGGNAVGGPVLGMAAEQAVKHPRETLEIIIAILLIIFLPTLFLIYLFFGHAAAVQQQQQKQQGQNPLQVTKTGPTTAKQGDLLTYTINVTFSGSADEIVITDPLPKGTTYSSSTQGGKPSADGTTVTWDIKNPGNPADVTVTLVLTATQDNTNIVNIASAQVLGAAGGCGNFDKTATTFEALMTGQGRCTNVLGNENQFVATLMKTGGTKFGFNGRQADLQAIYQAATAQRVNPLILVTIWGVESSFGTVDGENFNCGANFHDSFSDSLSCGVNTLNHYMTYFEQQKTKPVIIPPNCSFNDPFIYAYEWYTPVCHTSDGNGSSRANFVLFYKELMGI